MNKSHIDNFMKFHFEITQAIKNNDKKLIESLIISDKYPDLDKAKKESSALGIALTFFHIDVIDTKFFEYFIFEYRISEEVYKKQDYKNKIFDDMFKARRFKEELESQLLININNKESTKI